MQNCLVCGRTVNKIAGAVIAPWIRELSNIDSQQHTEFLKCSSRGFCFFEHRYTESEMLGLYENYRSSNYFHIRRNWEPWYSNKEIVAYTAESDRLGLSARKRFMDTCIRSAGLHYKDFSSCVDFGGDLGQFFPEEIAGKKYILDPSERPLINDDIVRIAELSEIGHEVDLVLNCHTLEHLGDFQGEIEKIYSVLKTGGVLYLEVPFDIFKTSRLHKLKAYSRYLGLLERWKFCFILMDFMSGVYRQFFNRVPFFGLVKQSEHINYFTLNSLEFLLVKNGFELKPGGQVDANWKQGRLKLGRMSVIGVKR